MIYNYSLYKPSGVEWIGAVPAHWSTAPLRWSCRIFSGGTPSKDHQEFWEGGAIPWLNSGEINKEVILYADNFITEEGYRGSSAKWIRPKSVLMALAGQGKTKGSVAVLEIAASCNQSMAAIEPKNKVFNYRYLYYYLKSQYNNIRGLVGDDRDGLNLDLIKEIRVPRPTIEEQSAIASYLDEKTTLIDETIRKKQRLSELLQEERTALINQAVTKGLDSSIPMKDSGVEWLGEVPAHWEVKKLKYFLGSVLGGGTPSTDKPQFWNGPLPWVSPKDMKVPSISSTEDNVTELALLNSSTSLVSSGSVLVVVRSGILKHSLPVAINTVPVTLNQDMKALEGNNALSNPYLFWMLTGCSSLLLTYTKKIGATVDSIDMEAFMNFYVAVPPKVEQDVIVAQLQTKQTDTERLIQRVSDECILLQEYRTALINEVVTGKRCVVQQPDLQPTT